MIEVARFAHGGCRRSAIRRPVLARQTDQRVTCEPRHRTLISGASILEPLGARPADEGRAHDRPESTRAGRAVIISQGTDWRILNELKQELKA